MKVMFKVFTLVFVLLFSQNLFAEDDKQVDEDHKQVDTEILQYYDSEFFQWNYNIWNGITLNFKEQSSTIFFGIPDVMKNAFSLYEDSSIEYNNYYDKMITGNILTFTGLGAALGGLTYSMISFDNLRNYTAGWIIFLGGALIELAGVIIRDDSIENLFNAVKLYNRHMINSYR